jgi:phosphohistidine phosphatase SixA
MRPHAAEIAARLMEDKHKLTIDRVLCNPAIRTQFDGVARSAAPDISAYLLRKAALKLRN